MKPFLYSILGVLLVSSCVTKPVTEPIPATRSEVSLYYRDNEDPRKYLIRVHEEGSDVMFERGNRVHPNFRTEIPFEKDPNGNKVPCVTTMAGPDEPVRMAIDTLSGKNWITLDKAAELNINPFGPQPISLPVRHMPYDYNGIAAHRWRIYLDTIPIESPIFFVLPIKGTLGKLARNQQIDMIAGNSLLSDFTMVQFDFHDQMLRLATSIDYEKPQGFDDDKLEWVLYEGSVLIEIHTPNYQGYALLDVLGDYHLAFPYLEEKKEIPFARIGAYTVGEVPVVNSFSVGLPPRQFPYVGRHFFDGARLTLNYKTGQLWLERIAPLDN